MARRSATNARYQKYTGPEGKTRKSAAAAKPKQAGSGSGSKATPAKSTSRRNSPLGRPLPMTPEFRAIRKQWWILMGVGFALTAISYLMRVYLKLPWTERAAAGVLGAAYATIIYAFYIDWTKMRPLRIAAYDAAKSGKTPKPEKAEKPAAENDASNDK